MGLQAHYRVVFCGQITEEYDLNTTKRRMAEVFHLPAKKTERLFSGEGHVVKSNTTELLATEFAVKLIEIGCECYVELMPLENDISQQPGFVERRTSVRRLRFRRGPRLNAWVPDRRELPSRRREDMILLERDGDFPGNTVKKPH